MTGWPGIARWSCGRITLTLLLLLTLSACGGGTQHASTGAQYGYTAPGPPEDPWGPYIVEAAHRFSIPERWIRAVMHQESGGHEYLNGQPITSDAGATGLMQVMPATYAELRDQYNLGPDPYNPHDNIVAGAGYIRQMYDRFGSPAFLAAYNAGPQRVQDYVSGRSGLPNETINYLASIAPRLGNDLPMTGPLVAYADNGGAALTPDPVPHAYARRPARCWQDPDAAYDPQAPCRSAPPVRLVAASPPVRHYAASANSPSCWHDPDAAYDPQAPCRPAPPPAMMVVASAPPAARNAHCWHDPDAAYDPEAPCRPAPPIEVAAAPPAPMRVAQAGDTAPGQMLWAGRAPVQTAPAAAHHNFASYLIPSAAAAEPPPLHASGAWAIQVGAFEDAGQARQVADNARGLDPEELRRTRTTLGATSPFGGHVLYRARLMGLSAQDASRACSLLATRAQACVTVPPGG